MWNILQATSRYTAYQYKCYDSAPICFMLYISTPFYDCPIHTWYTIMNAIQTQLALVHINYVCSQGSDSLYRPKWECIHWYTGTQTQRFTDVLIYRIPNTEHSIQPYDHATTSSKLIVVVIYRNVVDFIIDNIYNFIINLIKLVHHK